MGSAIRMFAGAVCALMLSLAPALADEVKKPTREEVQAVTEKAAALIVEKGLDDAGKAFNADGEFKHGEIYVNVIDYDGVWKVYPPRPAGVGQNVMNVKDPDGIFIVQEILKIAKDKGEGWVNYRWMNPASNKIEPKITFAKKVPGKDLVAYVGIYATP